MKAIILIFILFVSNFRTQSQSISNSSLRIGDYLPDISCSLYLNGKASDLKIVDFKGKLVILDFWGTKCLSCIVALPRLLKLQKEFENDLQIVLVTPDSKNEVDALILKLARNPSNKEHVNALKNIPLIFEDSLLHQYFPSTGQPTHVWLSKDQKFLAMTGGGSTNKENIKSYLRDERISLIDEYKILQIDKRNPLSWINQNQSGDSEIEYFSFIVKGNIGNVNSGVPFDYTPTNVNYDFDSTTNKIKGISCFNNSIISLYKIAYQNDFFKTSSIPLNQIIIESTNLPKFLINSNIQFHEWAKEGLYSYAVRKPSTSNIDLFATMKLQLDSYFSVKSRIENRVTPCIVLSQSKQTNPNFIDSCIFFKSNLNRAKDSTISIRITELIKRIGKKLSGPNSEYIFINQIDNFHQRNEIISFSANEFITPFTYINRKLNLIGLDLKIEMRVYPFLVIRDK